MANRTGPTASAEQVERLCESLRWNPNWTAAAEYAGIHPRSLREWRQRHDWFAAKVAGDESVADLASRRLYRSAREAWEAGNYYRASRILRKLYDRLDDDPEAAYWHLVERLIAERAKGELELVGIVRLAAKKDWRAAWALLKSGWPERYADRIEVTGAEGEALQVELADAEARARAALDSLEARRARDG